MLKYQRGRWSAFLLKYDWNKLLQETSTALIGLAVGLYYYESKELWQPFRVAQEAGLSASFLPDSLTSETARPYMWTASVLLALCLTIKMSLYFTAFNANRWKKNSKYRYAKANTRDINGVLQELLTATLGITLGFFTSPVVKNALVFEKAEYPDPTWGVILFFCGVFLKMLLYSKALDFNALAQGGGLRWNPGNVRPFLSKYDWNHSFQETSSTLLGIGMGFYLYESRIVFVVDKFIPDFSQRIREEGVGIWNSASEFLGSFIGRENAQNLSSASVQLIPDIFQDADAAFYVFWGGVCVVSCVVCKLMIYASWFDANSCKRILGIPAAHKRHSSGWNEAVDETLTLLLAMVASLLSTPLAKNALMDGEQQQTLGWFWLGLLLLLLYLKLAFLVGAWKLTRQR